MSCIQTNDAQTAYDYFIFISDPEKKYMDLLEISGFTKKTPKVNSWRSLSAKERGKFHSLLQETFNEIHEPNTNNTAQIKNAFKKAVEKTKLPVYPTNLKIPDIDTPTAVSKFLNK